MLRDAFFFLIGFVAGWMTFDRPQWATDAATHVWQWIKHKIKPDK